MSKKLQIEGCGDDRHHTLEKWLAYIPWNLVPLTQISKFYNSTNHFNHAQSTWSNQIVSGRNIWIANGRPTDKVVEVEVNKMGLFKFFLRI